MIGRRRLPPALLNHLAPRLAVAGVFLLLSIVGIVGSVLGARDSLDFEARSVVADAVVLGEGGDSAHVPLQFDVDGAMIVARAPVADREPYQPGEQVEVRYDPDRPTQVQLVEQPYDLATPLAFFTGLAFLAAGAMAVMVWRAARLLRLAASPATAFAFTGRLHHQDRMVRREQTWVVLGALDSALDAAPVASVPLLPGQVLPDARPFQALVKGDVRDGGTAVVMADDVVLWPSGRVRVTGLAGPRGD